MSAEPVMTEPLIAQTPEQARLLQDFPTVAVLGRLLEGEASAGEIAASTGQTVKQVHHRLTRLLRAGLIEVSAERRRAGRPVKVYRALAGEYQVPFALTSAATLGELVQGAHEPMLSAHYRAVSGSALGKRDLRLRRMEGGGMTLTLAEAGEAPPHALQSVFLSYRLTHEAASELERRLKDLSRWLSEQHRPPEEDGTDYLLGLLLAPGKIGE